MVIAVEELLPFLEVICLLFLKQYILSIFQTFMEGVLDRFALVILFLSSIETINLLLLSLQTCLLLVLESRQQLFEFSYFVQLSLPIQPALCIFIMQSLYFSLQIPILSLEVGDPGIKLIDPSLQLQILLFGLDVLVNINISILAWMWTINGGLAGTVGMGNNAFQCGKIGVEYGRRLLLIGLG